MNEKQMREKFEAHVLLTWHTPRLEKDTLGNYKNKDVLNDWITWQAAIASIEPNLIWCTEDEEGLATRSAKEFAENYADGMEAGCWSEVRLTCGVTLPARIMHIKKGEADDYGNTKIEWEWVKCTN